MCFLKSERTKHKKSDTDFDCYKLMYLGFYSGKLRPLFHCSNEDYSVGDTMIPLLEVADETIDKSHVVNGGVIYSYTSLITARDAKRGLLSTYPHINVTIVRCTIPAGTSYWRNCQGEIISKKLVVKEILKR